MGRGNLRPVRDRGPARPKKLILAAADAAEQSGEPPSELRYAWLCQTWGALPKSGGMDDQDAGQMLRMNALRNVYRVMRAAYEAKSMTEWAEANYEDFKVWVSVDEMRREDE